MCSHPVLVQPSGLRFDAPAGTSVLLAAQAAGIKLPSSCRNGTCRSCICLRTGGQTRHLIDWPGLSAEEKLEGHVLPCCAVAVEATTLWQPRARRS